MANSKYFILKQVLTTTIIGLLGCASIIFSLLYIDTFSEGFFYKNAKCLHAICVGFISVLTLLTSFFFSRSHVFIFKLSLIFIVMVCFFSSVLYLLKIKGILEVVSSVEGLREYIEGFGGLAIVFFLIIQFFQVLILPIPSFVLLGAGVLLFGPIKGAIICSIGVISGSIVAFLIGKIFGYKLAKWLVGDKLDKWLKLVEGKSKILFSIMFLFPFFPDDVLCVIAGITQMSLSSFFLITTITRSISIFVSALSLNNSLIPYDTWWGILLWGVIALIIIAIIVFIFMKLKQKTKQLKNQ